MIVGMIRPNSGKAFLEEREITTLPMYKRARLGIGYLPQEASVFRRLSVHDNVLAVLQTTSLSKKEQEEKCMRLLDEFGLLQVQKSLGYVTFSGGERRRTEIARSLALYFGFMLLDEPFAGIDPIAVEDIMHIDKRLKDKNIGILITDHNVHETLLITDRSYSSSSKGNNQSPEQPNTLQMIRKLENYILERILNWTSTNKKTDASACPEVTEQRGHR